MSSAVHGSSFVKVTFGKIGKILSKEIIFHLRMLVLNKCGNLLTQIIKE